MIDFLSALAILFCFMFSGVASWLLLPVIAPIRWLLRGGHNRQAWGKVLTDLLAIAVLASLSAQLVLDHQRRLGSFGYFAPWIAALFLFVFVLEASIDKRLEVINDNRKWTRYPEHSSDIRFWRVPAIAVLPLFLTFMILPAVGIPYAYTAFRAATRWLFAVPYIGLVLKWIAVILGIRFAVGCLYFLLLRTSRALSGSSEVDAVTGSGIKTESEYESISEKVANYREAIGQMIEAEDIVLSASREKFGEGYGASGFLLCKYADIIANATIENLRSRSTSELPSSQERIKQVIIDVTKTTIVRQEYDSTIGLLRILYVSLARFLPESQSSLVTERNLGWLSEDPNHPDLRKSKQAEEIDAEVDAEERRLAQEFNDITLELLQNELGKTTSELTKAQKELLQVLYDVNPDDPGVVEDMLDDSATLNFEIVRGYGLMLSERTDVWAIPESKLPYPKETIRRGILRAAVGGPGERSRYP